MNRIAAGLLALALAFFATLASAQSPVRGFPPGTFQSRAPIDAASGGGGRTCTDDTASTNFLSRTGGSFPNYGAGSTHYADAICTFIKALETAGLITGNLSGTNSCGSFTGNTAGWDGVWLMKAHTSANSLLNICGTANPLVNHGTTFTADVGYTGAASSWVDTQLDLNTVGQCTVNNCSVFAGTSTNFSSGSDYGSLMGSGGIFIDRIYPHYSNNNFYYGVNGAGANLTAPTPGHFYGAIRVSSAGATAYIDTTAAATDTTASTSPPVSLSLVADDGTGLDPYAGIETFAAVGAGMTGTQEAALQSAYATYVASVP